MTSCPACPLPVTVTARRRPGGAAGSPGRPGRSNHLAGPLPGPLHQPFRPPAILKQPWGGKNREIFAMLVCQWTRDSDPRVL